MRLDIVLPNEGTFGIQAMETGPYYEAMGWDGIWLSDHLLGIAEDYIHTDAWLDIFIAMAHLAAKTRTVRIGSGIVVLPYRDPVLTARMVASLDQLSGGRIDFGVGVGWLRREYQAVGVGHAFDERGAYSNEMLDVILTCWKGGEKVRAAGMKFGYHNHSMEFQETDGVAPYTELLRLTDPGKVIMEMDCGWVVVGGGDPVEYLTKYPTRIGMLHVKDFKRPDPASGRRGGRPAELGQGHIDYRRIFAAAAKAGHVTHCFVEQEGFDMPPMDSLKIDADYMRSLGIG